MKKIRFRTLRKSISSLVILLISLTAYTQNNAKYNVTDVFKITFLNPGISYEKSIGISQTLFAHAYMTPNFAFSYSSSFGSTTYFSIDPGLTFQYRYYYNYSRRQQKSKRTEMNSMNYISPLFTTIFSKSAISDKYYTEDHRRGINTFGIVWGMQRNYEKRFSLDLELGGGYEFTTATTLDAADKPIKTNVGKITILAQVNIGLWLNGRK